MFIYYFIVIVTVLSTLVWFWPDSSVSCKLLVSILFCSLFLIIQTYIFISITVPNVFIFYKCKYLYFFLLFFFSIPVDWSLGGEVRASFSAVCFLASNWFIGKFVIPYSVCMLYISHFTHYSLIQTYMRLFFNYFESNSHV